MKASFADAVGTAGHKLSVLWQPPYGTRLKNIGIICLKFRFQCCYCVFFCYPTPRPAPPLAMQETDGPTELMLNRDIEGEPPSNTSNVLEAEVSIPIDSMEQPDTVEQNNARTIGDGDREPQKGTQQTSSPEEEARKCFKVEPIKSEGVSKDAHRMTNLQAKPMAFDDEKSEPDDDCGGHEALPRDGRHLTTSPAAQEGEEEGREGADGRKREEDGGNEQGENPEESTGGGGATAQGSVNNSRKYASRNKVRFDQPATCDKETRDIQARGVDMPADREGVSVGKLCDRLLNGGDGDGESSGPQREAVTQVTWRGEIVPLAKAIVVTINGSRLGLSKPEGHDHGETESQSRGRDPIISDGRNKQLKTHSRNLTAEDPVNDALSSDERSDDQIPAQKGEGKTRAESCSGGRYNGNTVPGGKRTSSSRSHALRSARDGGEQAKRVGERRRSSAEASAATQISSEAKREAADRAFLRSDDNNSQSRCCRRQRAREQALPVARSSSPTLPTSSRDHGTRGSVGHGRALSRLTRPVFFLANPYLGPPVASCPRAWPCGNNVMVDSTLDYGRHRRPHRGRPRRVSNKHESGTSRKARKRLKSGERAVGEGGLRSRSSEQKDPSPFKRRSRSATSSSSSSISSNSSYNGSSSSHSSASSGSNSSGGERKKGERLAEAKRGPTTRSSKENTSEERWPRRGSIQRTSTIGEEKGDEAW